jgi:hypothetical protein
MRLARMALTPGRNATFEQRARRSPEATPVWASACRSAPLLTPPEACHRTAGKRRMASS